MKPDTKRTYAERMLKVLVFIQNHLDEVLELDRLAAVAHFSPYHFHRVFRGMVGESLKSHIRRLRLERAAHRLKRSDQPVTRIAFDAGYETHEAFARAFRTMFDESPSGFRTHHQAIAWPDVPSGVHFVADGSLSSFVPVQTGGVAMDVRVEKVDPMHVAFVRHTGPYNEVGSAWGKLCAMAGPAGLMGPSMTMLGVAHDDPSVTPPERVRYDACIVVDDGFAPAGEVGVQVVGGGDYAVATHRGPYEKLNETYAALCGQWLPAHGRELRSAPALEFYKNSPQDTPPEKLVTDVYLPLE